MAYIIVKRDAVITNDNILLKRAMHFLELHDNECTEKIFSMSLAAADNKKMNKVSILPLTDDLEKASEHMVGKIRSLTEELRRESKEGTARVTCRSTWICLAKVTLARIILFNKRRSLETSKIAIETFNSQPKLGMCDTTLKSFLSPLG